jgi:hypothetical protein
MSAKPPRSTVRATARRPAETSHDLEGIQARRSISTHGEVPTEPQGTATPSRRSEANPLVDVNGNLPTDPLIAAPGPRSAAESPAKDSPTRSRIALPWTTPRPQRPAVVPDVDQDRERMRGRIALALIGLLAFVVLLAFLGLLTRTIEVRDLKELLIFLGPLIALVSTAVGFYFGGAKK